MNRLILTRARISYPLQLQRKVRIWQNNVSTKSAIRKGLRSPSTYHNERTSQFRIRDQRTRSASPRKLSPTSKARQIEKKTFPGSSDFLGHHGKRDSYRSSLSLSEERTTEWRKGRGPERKRAGPRRSSTQSATQNNGGEPISLPYTSSASEFLYGTNVVTTALKLNRRKLYKLFIYQGHQTNKAGLEMHVRRLALERGVPTQRLSGQDGLRMMDKMSAGRPHNGFVLEASPLPRLPITGLCRLHAPNARFEVVLDHQSSEDALVNGTDSFIRYDGKSSRYPLVLVLDGILDPGNLGAILRSSFFLGVDAVTVNLNSTAPLSPVALKASAGAAEAMPILTLKQNTQFIAQCRASGWKIFAADVPQERPGNSRKPPTPSLTTSNLGAPLQDSPCILLMGSEEKGLYPDVMRQADCVVSIEGTRAGQAGVESLNVSVAAALLCDAFLRSSVPRKNYSAKDTNNDTRHQDRLF